MRVVIGYDPNAGSHARASREKCVKVWASRC